MINTCKSCGASAVKVYVKPCGGYVFGDKDYYAIAMCKSCGISSHSYCTRNIRAAAHGIVFDIDKAQAAALDELTAPEGIQEPTATN